MEAIICCDNQMGYAKNGDIPWLGRYPLDMQLFKNRTENKIMVVGAGTYNSVKHLDGVNGRSLQLYKGYGTFKFEQPVDNYICIGGWKTIVQLKNQISGIWITVLGDWYVCDKRIDLEELSNFKLMVANSFLQYPHAKNEFHSAITSMYLENKDYGNLLH